MTKLNRGLWAIALCALALHFLVVVRYSVNVPFWDEWEALLPGNLDAALHPRWLLAFHNTNRNVPTNLSIWVLYRLGGWNLNAQAALNFLVYAGMTVGFLRFLERRYGVGMGLAALFPASALADESHIHPFNGCWTFFLAAFFAAVIFALRKDRWGWLAAAFAVVSMYSMLGGVVCALAFIGLCCGLAWLRPELRRRHLAQAALVAVFLGLWWIGFPGDSAPIHGPLERVFWSYWAELVALGFGYGYPHVGILRGVLILGGVAALAALLLKRRWRAEPERRADWLALFALMAGLLGELAAISLGRSWGGAKSGRYAEVALFLVPLTCVLFGLVGKTWTRQGQVRVASLLLGALLVFPLPRWFDFPAIYGHERERRLAGLACLQEHYQRGGPAFCPDIQNDSAVAAIEDERAQQLGLSFLRQ